MKEVASVEDGQAQFEVYRKQAALNYPAGGQDLLIAHE